MIKPLTLPRIILAVLPALAGLAVLTNSPAAGACIRMFLRYLS